MLRCAVVVFIKILLLLPLKKKHADIVCKQATQKAKRATRAFEKQLCRRQVKLVALQTHSTDT